MTDRPTPSESPDGPHGAPDGTVAPPSAADRTEPLSPPPASPPSGPAPSGPAQYGPAQYGPGWSGVAPAVPQRTSSARRLWQEATATTGSRVALAVAGALVVLLVVAGIGVAGALLVHRVDVARVSQAADDAPGPWGNGMGPNGMGPNAQGQRGGGRAFGDDGQGSGTGRGQGRPGTGPGRGGVDGGGLAGIPGLGALLHGEFTTSVTGTPTVMVFQTGQVTQYTAGQSLAVTSSDGFKATYVLDSSTTTRGAVALQNGTQVRVVAAKDGMKAVLVWPVRTTG